MDDRCEAIVPETELPCGSDQQVRQVTVKDLIDRVLLTKQVCATCREDLEIPDDCVLRW